MSSTTRISFMAGIGLIAVGVLNAQETPRFSFNVGGGFTEPVGNTGTQLDTGWNVQAGAGYNFNPYLGAMIQFSDSRFNVNGATLNSLGFPGGNVNLSSFTLDPVIHTNPRGPVDVYFIGGGGLYHWRQEFTAPTVEIVNGFDPFFGFFQEGIPATEVLTSYTVNKPGANAGVGVSLGTHWHVKVYAEARYNRVFFSNGHADFLPVTFGFRW